MDFNSFFTDLGVTNFIIKAFCVVFSVLYCIYTLIISRQTKIMSKTIKSNNSHFVLAISTLQVFISLILIILSVFLI